MKWSAGKTANAASGSRQWRKVAARPIAGAVSRPIGSSMMFSDGIRSRSRRMRSECSWAVTTKTWRGSKSGKSRSTVWRTIVVDPRMGRVCLGLCFRESGQNRVPLPPAITTA